MKKFHWNLAFYVLSFYCFGAGIMDSFVIYDGWQYVGKEEFAAMHTEMGQRIVLLFVMPMLLLFILSILQYWFRPEAIPRSWVTMAVVAQLGGWASSVFIQIPIQLLLDKGKDEALLEKLIVSDWIRFVAWIVYLTIVLAMLYRINKAYLQVSKRKFSV